MDGTYVRPFVLDGAGGTIVKESFHTGDRVAYWEGVASFSHLIDVLYEAYSHGHTVPLAAFRRYLIAPDDYQPRTMRAHGIMRSP